MGSHIRRQSEANVARRLKTAIKHANCLLDELGIESISERVTRTRPGARLPASARLPVNIADQLGHTDPRFTLSVYAKATKRRAKLSAAYLAEYEKALAWAALRGNEKALIGTGKPRQAEQPRSFIRIRHR